MPITPPPPSNTPRTSPATLRDRRVPPPGVMPRSIQVWIMAGLALVIVGIIVMTGSPTPPERAKAATPAAAARPVSPSRVESYQETVDQRARLLQEELARARQESGASTPVESPLAPDYAQPATTSEDPLRDEQRRREYQSLFAEVVVHSRRDSHARPSMREAAATSPAYPVPMGMPFAHPQSAVSNVPMESISTPSTSQEQHDARVAPASTGPAAPTPALPLTGDAHTLLEGTLIETVLTNRLDGTFSGPVNVLVTTPVLAHGGQTLVIPAGARLLGSASPVTGWGDARLAIRFHRLVLPDGRTFSLEQFQGLNQIGETGLKDRVDRHYLQVFGASLAVGALSGLTQFSTRSSADQSFSDLYRQGAGAGLAQSSARILERFLNQLPTITIREGHRIKVSLTSDLTLPAWFDGRDRRPFVPSGGPQ